MSDPQAASLTLLDRWLATAERAAFESAELPIKLDRGRSVRPFAGPRIMLVEDDFILGPTWLSC
jgi:hypothetical protein